MDSVYLEICFDFVVAVVAMMQALKERQEMELKQAENILHSALETALDYKVQLWHKQRKNNTLLVRTKSRER